MTDTFLITCEHGGNRIPPAYRRFFQGQRALLDSHCGYDPGALVLAGTLAGACKGLLLTSTVSRLLVDLNRSIGNPRVFSAATRSMPPAMRAAIVEQYYRPYRDQAERFVSRSIARGRRVVHISAHSFTPELHGKVRRADVGLLYDPGRRGEVALCGRWKEAMASLAPDWRVLRNSPYAGKGDGLASHLRLRFPTRSYVGIELEVNQRIVFRGGRRWRGLQSDLVRSLLMASSA